MRTILFLTVLCAGAYAQFSKAGQNAIVDAHNKLRSSIAKGTYVAKGVKKPAGSNILKIVRIKIFNFFRNHYFF